MCYISDFRSHIGNCCNVVYVLSPTRDGKCKGWLVLRVPTHIYYFFPFPSPRLAYLELPRKLAH